MIGVEGQPYAEPAFLPHALQYAMAKAVNALRGELWIERDRRWSLEALLKSKDLLQPADIEGFELGDEQKSRAGRSTGGFDTQDL